MRFLRTDSLEVVELDEPFPPYVMLSHTWGKVGDEVTYQEMALLSNKTACHEVTPFLAGIKMKPGYAKIKACCDRARQDQFDYVWIDTCCIDKTNSTELSEAINSMYRWYRDARICYAYLEDVPGSDSTTTIHENARFSPLQAVRNSRWFKRGWTLQELIAPEVVEFYAYDWTEIGTKASMAQELSQITGIDSRILYGEDVSACNVAERMSWAASRETTRVEDGAYSLLGIFRVSMPLLYGEGRRAFLRLQNEILKITEDYSILAWDLASCIPSSVATTHELPDTSVPEAARDAALVVQGAGDMVNGSLATTCVSFHTGSSDAWTYSDVKVSSHSLLLYGPTSTCNYTPPTMTSKGLRLWILLRQCSPTIYLAYINCMLLNRVICMTLRVSQDDHHAYERIIPSHKGYAFLPPDCLGSFTFRRIYLIQDRRPTPQTQRSPFLSNPISKLVVNAADLECSWGWSVVTQIDKLHSGSQLFIPMTNPQVIRCLYQKTNPFLVVVGRERCEIVLPLDLGLKYSSDDLVTDGLWNQRLLYVMHHSISDKWSRATLPRDRDSRELGGRVVTVAYKRLLSQTVVKLTLM